MELLERDWALTRLVDARESASRGRGRVVVVTGEPGIGKTWLVKQFLEDVGKDSAGDSAFPGSGAARHPGIADRRTGGATSADGLGDRGRALGRRCTLDLITVLGRRIGSLPAVLVLTFRAGEAPPGHRLHATVGAIRAEDTVVVELPPLSERAVTALAGHGADKVYAATGGNPFYVTEMLAAIAWVDVVSLGNWLRSTSRTL